jgi:hypothetical protein
VNYCYFIITAAATDETIAVDATNTTAAAMVEEIDGGTELFRPSDPLLFATSFRLKLYEIK